MRHQDFVAQYRQRRLDEAGAGDPPRRAADESNEDRGRRRAYLGESLRWLWPHRVAVGVLFLNIAGRASIGDIMAFQWYTFLLLNPVWQLVNSFSELQQSLAAMERVFEVMGMDDDKPDRPDSRDAPRVVHEIRFENVAFEYRERRPAVRDFNVTVPGESVVALVGRSGAAKRR